jgi:site-specific DNA-adenine methylase
MLQPFWAYYGGKWRAAPKYPYPQYDVIIEPFAGAAGYSTRYYDRRVTLLEKDGRIASLWMYLTQVEPSEILSIPLLATDQTVDDLNVCEEAKTLVGFWINKGSAQPKKAQSKWMLTGGPGFWSEIIRARIARQVTKIRHWTVHHGSYDEVGNAEATWFIDPPYMDAGIYYRHSSKSIDYPALADWCLERLGQVIVCENTGATWLPFRHLASIRGNRTSGSASSSKEATWTNKPMGQMDLCPT